jgi:hypothetical protein
MSWAHGAPKEDFWLGTVKEKAHWTEMEIDLRVLLKWTWRKSVFGIDPVHRDEDVNKWLVFVTKVMNIRVAQMRWISGQAEELLASEEDFAPCYLLSRLQFRHVYRIRLQSSPQR